MKTACSGLLAFFLCFVSEAQFHDSFSDGDFHANPQWTGDTAYFFVNSNLSLQSNGPASSGEIYLSTPWSKIKNTIWEFEAILDFPTSSSNYARVYLSADRDSLEEDLQGYYLRLGGSSGSTDAIDLYRQDGDENEKIISGIEGFFGADSNHVQFRVIRDFYGNWSLFADSSASGNLVLQGSGFDSTYSLSTHFGIACRHTSSRKDLFFFDDFSIRNGDLELLSAKVLNDSNIVLQFSSILDPNSVDTSQVSVDSGLIQLKEIRVHADRLHLRLGEALEAGWHSVSVRQISDDQQNVLISDTLMFHFLPPPEFGDIIFNEVMADPEPQVGLPTKEYVEIMNISDSDQRLSELEYSDAGTALSLPDEIIASGEIIILCKAEDTLDFGFFGRSIGLDPWPALNNSGDKLALKRKDGQIVDEIDYDISWYQNPDKSDGGWSIERINPFRKCSDLQNWMASNEGSGGTPGYRNSVFDDTPDTNPPQIEWTEIVSDYQLEIHFPELLDSLNARPAIHTSPELDFQWIHTGSRSVKISFVQPFDSGVLHQIFIDSLQDCEGNMALGLHDHFGLGRSPETFELVISEIMADPEPAQGLGETEYFEILNSTSEMISLRGLQIISHKDSSDLPGITLMPGAYLVFSPSSGVELLSTKTNAVKLSPWPGLNNAGDHLKIDFSGNTIFEIDYDQDWMDENSKKNGGWSLEMIDPGNPCGENDNWTGSRHPDGGTPGSRNSVYASNPDLKGPQILDYSLPDSTAILLYLNEKVSLDALTLEHFKINGREHVLSVSADKSYSAEIRLQVEEKHRPKINYTLKIEELSDCIPNYSFNQSIDFVLPELPDSGDLLINEILPDPYSGASEFIEIVNVSHKIINLKNLKIKTVDEQNAEKSSAILSSEALLFHPGEFLLLAVDTTGIMPFYSYSDQKTYFEVADFPTLSNEEGFLLLLDSSGKVLDSVFYSEKNHFELIHDTRGVSFERISLTHPAWQQDNWSSAAETFGFGTPGLPNSKRFSSESYEEEITIYPALFSPDGDGYNDLVHISFNSDNTQTMLTLEIYDTAGILKKQLANNVSTAFQNSFFWDGIDESGKKSPMGNYILLAEYFNAEGKTKKIRKVISLGGRL